MFSDEVWKTIRGTVKKQEEHSFIKSVSYINRGNDNTDETDPAYTTANKTWSLTNMYQ